MVTPASSSRRGGLRLWYSAACCALLAVLCAGVRGSGAAAVSPWRGDTAATVDGIFLRAMLAVHVDMSEPSRPAAASRYPPFSFDACGDAAPALRLSGLELAPDPIVLPGPLNVTLGAWSLKRQLDAPLRVAVTMEKEVFGVWKSVPCVDGVFGSCEFEDVCASLAALPCPTWAVALGLPCRCPLQPGGGPRVAMDLDIPAPLPIPELAGSYRIRVKVLGDQDPGAGCYVTVFTVLNQPPPTHTHEGGDDT